jgi:hypothetical protein
MWLRGAVQSLYTRVFRQVAEAPIGVVFVRLEGRPGPVGAGNPERDESLGPRKQLG